MTFRRSWYSPKRFDDRKHSDDRKRERQNDHQGCDRVRPSGDEEISQRCDERNVGVGDFLNAGFGESFHGTASDSARFTVGQVSAQKAWVITLTDVAGAKQYLAAGGVCGVTWCGDLSQSLRVTDVERAGRIAGRMRRLNRRAMDRGDVILLEEVAQ